MFAQAKLNPMTLTELLKSTIDASKERLKTPIVGSYICSFIIFNWKPLVILIFSTEKIEGRILAVERYYTPWYCMIISIGIPIVIALLYTFGIPMLMVWIEARLEPTKEKRIKRIYRSKEFIIKEKITLAESELELKNAISGNKEKQDLLDQIEALKESNIQITAVNKNSINQLNFKLKEANETIEELNNAVVTVNSSNQVELAKPPLKKSLRKPLFNSQEYKDQLMQIAYGKLTKSQLEQILSIQHEPNGFIDISNVAINFLEDLVKVDIIERDDDNYYFSNHGREVYKYLKDQNSIENQKLGNQVKD